MASAAKEALWFRTLFEELDEIATEPANNDLLTALRSRVQNFDFAGYASILKELSHDR